ncbi:phosphoglycerate mutase [Ectothiorhodosinus mongolicus]|uniref:2,3-bisphosphoglycerate-independent phosphoglycerate mutase n=1 Tax=Ectothiorhodosinus mongolicus TaxID=233100 RepID=A0A1R3VY72_9GAMM|nr:2,3-bisphosphoglycerate-independent phosphoglycerate mutase [Ectothiorhodosinus mongolicus]ULX57109.1 2,3-bisphosphoglycerate-independent phosphoglycerate mutase [Ectothiorhodosinus mongolicus]SIT69972.1 phosphoglycerate mutase [Ectothiorhodosinus mongolicus]
MSQPVSSPPRRRTLLVIMDGIGVNPSKHHNAWHLAATPRLDELLAHHPHTLIETAGRAVGLPDGQMGNSEVGHLTLGCGTIIRQDLVRIDDAIADGSITNNPALVAAIDAAAQANRPLHLLGLVSDGGVHSHLRHLLALVHLCGEHGVRPVVHMITDGRDTAPRCAASYLQELEPALNATDGVIASVCGRYYAMDRDKRWDRIKLAFDALVHGAGQVAESASAAIEDAYQCGETDEFIKPRVIHHNGCIRPGDAVVFFNFRNDRPRQLTEALSQADFEGFDRGEFQPIQVTCLTLYDRRFDLPVAFSPERPELTLAKVISEAGLSQFHCAETEKYPHVTFFFNGGVEKPAVGEEHVMIPSPPVATYDLQPEMSAPGVADATIGALRAKRDFVLVNFANGDMVGHTAIPEAVIAAVEAVDSAIGRLVDVALEEDYSIIITADHGNCEEMVDPVSGEPHTQHTVYPVACIVMDPSSCRLRTGGGLSDIAATVLMLMGLNKPEGMSGRSLLID